MKGIFATFIVISVVVAACATSVDFPGSICDDISLDGESKYSLKALSGYQLKYTGTASNNTWIANICGALPFGCPNTQSPGNGTQCPAPFMASSCNFDSQRRSFCLGHANTIKFAPLGNSPEFGLSVIYDMGDNKQSTQININCDKLVTGAPRLISFQARPDGHTAVFSVLHIAGCPVLPTPPCSFVANGSSFDLAPISNVPISANSNTGYYSYQFQFCTPLEAPCPNTLGLPSSCAAPRTAAVCQTYLNGQGTQCDGLNSAFAYQYLPYYQPNVLTLRYFHGDCQNQGNCWDYYQRRSTFIISCDRNRHGTPRSIQAYENGYETIFQFQHSVACPTPVATSTNVVELIGV